MRLGPIPFRTCLILPMLLVGLVGCDRDVESGLRDVLDEYVHLGNTRYFESKRTCTAGVFELSNSQLTDAIILSDGMAMAQLRKRENGSAAISIPGYSGNDLAEGMLLMGDGVFGRHVLESAATVRACLTDEIMAEFRSALTQVGGTLVYLAEVNGMFVIDPNRDRLYYAAGSPL